MKDKFKEHAAEFKGDDEVEEELDEERIDIREAENEHFDEED